MSCYKGFAFDLDGTLFRGSMPIPGAVETVNWLADRGYSVGYVSNNSSATVDQYVSKLSGMGFPVQPNAVVSSASVTLNYLLEHQITDVFVVGEPGLEETLRAEGIQVRAHDASNATPPEAVVVGICRSRLSYALLDQAMQLIVAGALFIATNRDASYPVESHFSPGAGAIVGFLEICTGKTPTLMGKPEPKMLELLLKRWHLNSGEILMVGDRNDTDIACGILAGCDSALVMSGVDSEISNSNRALATECGRNIRLFREIAELIALEMA